MDFFKPQSALATYCRSNGNEHLEGFEAQRIKHYRRLIFNLIDDAIRSTFEKSFELLDNTDADFLIQHFIKNNNCQSPYFWKMPKEFLLFVEQYHQHFFDKYFLLHNLMQLEWYKIELFMDADKNDFSTLTTDGDLLTNKLVLNKDVAILHFHYPVHLKETNAISPADKQDYFCCMHRNTKDDEVYLMDISPLFVRWIEMSHEENLSLNEFLNRISTEFNIEINDAIQTSVVNFFYDALKNNLLLGFER